ncbi:MAG: transcription antitermination factor NusB [Gammaproteobacteria bacterium]|nr:transcription antitermination factor NusB [Gammaproteobacteria bacterium]
MARGSRERARGLLIKALYQWQLAGHGYDELIEQYSALAEFKRIDDRYFAELLRAVIDDAAALDAIIAAHAARGLDQLDAVGRAVLLLALAELKHRSDVPEKVVINEAVELAKRFGAADSYRFVNAVADKAAKQLRHETASEASAG